MLKDEEVMHIYRITNKLNKKKYIGKTKKLNVQTRWNQHVSTMKHGLFYKKKLCHLHNAFHKYGTENFLFEIIETLHEETNLNDREIYWIKLEQPEYNKSLGGDGLLGYKHKPRTEATKEKISRQSKDRIFIYNLETLEERRVKKTEIYDINVWTRGRSPKTKHGGKRGEYNKKRSEKFINWLKNNPNPSIGYKHTEEAKLKISEKAKNRKRNQSGINNPMFGKKLYNNGIITKGFKEPPLGEWILGPLKKIKKDSFL